MEDNNCIFCKIIKGEIPSSKVYEDENFLAFLDIRPITFGHTLVIPKKHRRNALDSEDDLNAEMYRLATRLAKVVKKAFDADGINLMQNNEPSSGQEVFHSHIHIIPRKENDHAMNLSPRKERQMADLALDAEKIKGAF